MTVDEFIEQWLTSPETAGVDRLLALGWLAQKVVGIYAAEQAKDGAA